MVTLCFGGNFLNLDIDKLLSSKPLVDNVKLSHKYNQIRSSIKELGVIEPIIVYYDGSSDAMKILDGHLRVEALKDLQITKVPCIISTIDDAFTPNKQVSHITVVQEHRMIIQALSKVSIEKLSAALGVSIDSIKQKTKTLKGIDPAVITKLSNKQVPRGTFDVLKKMKPVRQLEAVGAMINFDNFSKNFVVNILNSTPSNMLVANNENSYSKDIKKSILRLEKEMSMTSEETSKLKGEYGSNMLKFVIAQSYIKRLLDNPKILHWLLENHKDYLDELKRITKINSLEPAKD